MRDKGKAGSLLCYVLSFFIVLLNNIQSKENKNAKDCIKIDFSKWYYYYDNGVYNNKYYIDYFTVYITSRYYKMDSPSFCEVKIYDDDIKTIFYLFTDKKVYMSVNPDKEPMNKKSRDAMTENDKFINTGRKLKYYTWDIEIWRIIRYGTKESEAGMIDTYSYIARDLLLPNSYFNFHTSEEKIRTVTTIAKRSAIPGPSVRSVTKFYDKSGTIRFISEEKIIDIKFIKSDNSIFKIPDDYKKIEWDPELFKY